MVTLDLLELRERLNAVNALISFNGPLTEGLIKDLGEAVRHYLEQDSGSRAQVMDVFSVFIEQTQNIRQYAVSRAADAAEQRHLSSAICVISPDQGHYLVSSGNWVRREDASGLTAHLERLRGLDAEGLKRFYKEVLRAPVGEGATTAGLGLIDMARKSRRPLDYSCQESPPGGPEGFVFFSLQAVV